MQRRAASAPVEKLIKAPVRVAQHFDKPIFIFCYRIEHPSPFWDWDLDLDFGFGRSEAPGPLWLPLGVPRVLNRRPSASTRAISLCRASVALTPAEPKPTPAEPTSRGAGTSASWRFAAGQFGSTRLACPVKRIAPVSMPYVSALATFHVPIPQSTIRESRNIPVMSTLSPKTQAVR